MKKKYLIIERQWACSKSAVWLYLGNFLLFPIFHTTRNGVLQLNLIKKNQYGELLVYFSQKGYCLVMCLVLENVIKKNQYGEDSRYFGGEGHPNVYSLRSVSYVGRATKWARVHRPPYKV